MITTVHTATTLGLSCNLIRIELDISPSLPTIIMVGLPDKAVQESKERVKSAIKHSGFEFPLGKITVNLAPADTAKTGTGFDLPIAVGILASCGFIKTQLPQKTLIIGELGLDGSVRGVSGLLTTCLWAKEHGFTSIIFPAINAKEASLISGLQLYPAQSLTQVVQHLDSIQPIPKIEYKPLVHENSQNTNLHPNDMAYIKGQTMAKRALEIAASGGHNVLFIGSPGSGKTLLARAFPTILPAMTEHEMIESTQVYSSAGLLDHTNLISTRPFRSPHHSSSHISLVGGGSKLRPGEISLAHRGVLFLDEFPEFSRESIETLRQPLEDGFVTISRATGTVKYPSRFMLVAAANPTPSGYDIDDPASFNKPQNLNAIKKYQAKFSGPILDRIDMQVEVDRPSKEEIQSRNLSESSHEMLQRIEKARNIQTDRFKETSITTNSEMSLSMIQTHCNLDTEGKQLIDKAIDVYKLSARSYMRILKLSRTIADLEGTKHIEKKHIAESLQFRGKWG
jgi:magnesium chelatase family protein